MPPRTGPPGPSARPARKGRGQRPIRIAAAASAPVVVPFPLLPEYGVRAPPVPVDHGASCEVAALGVGWKTQGERMRIPSELAIHRGSRARTGRRILSLAVILGVATATGLPIAPPGASWPASAAAAGDPVIAAAGDIACDPASSSFHGGSGTSSSCRQLYTSDLLAGAGYSAVLALGDNQYYCGGYSAFLGSYDLSWGRIKAITHPAVGNHEYLTSGGTGCDVTNTGAAGYFKYFGGAAGDPAKGYYSFDVGAWHLIALNSNCTPAGGCGTNSPQWKWLLADLVAHPTTCTLAYWHIPLYSSGGRAAPNMGKLWQLLYDNNADLVLEGHDHLYERFAPQNAIGGLDVTRGLRSFIVGTGGANHTSVTTVAPNSEIRDAATYGILALTLHPASYDWRFVPEAGKTFTDTGTTACHGSTTSNDTTPPSTPTGLAATAPSGSGVALSWNAASDNVGVASYRISRGGTAIGTSSTATFTDSTVAPNTTYSYTVSAADQAGNRSPESAPVSITTPGSLAFTAAADAWIEQDLPTTNFGTGTSIQVDGSPVKRSLMRFSVTGTGTGGVAKATLRLFCTNPSSFGGEVRSVTATWSETGVTWNTSPAFGSSTVASLGSVVVGAWYDLDVTSLVRGDGDVSFGMLSSNANGAIYTSREGVSAQRPQLIVTPGQP